VRATTPGKWSPTPTRATFGAELGERALVPEANARLGEIRFEDWLAQSAVPSIPAARA